MINRVVLVGRLVRDPELRRTASGIPVATFTVAVDNRVKSNNEKSASFIPCVVWNQAADNVAKYTRKGSLVGIDGRIVQRTYDKKEGGRASIVEIVCDSVQFLEPKSSNNGPSENDYQPDEPVDDSKNLESVDLVGNDLPF